MTDNQKQTLPPLEPLHEGSSDSPSRPRAFTKFSETLLPTRGGTFQTAAYRNQEGEEHIAISLGLDEPQRADSPPPLVRIHSACFTGEVLGSMKCDCREQLEYALKAIQAEGRGLVLYLFQEGRGIGLGAKIQVYALQEQGFDTVDANTHLGFEEDARSYECALDMLEELGVKEVRLLTNNPQKIAALTQGGIRVERAPIEVVCHPVNQNYLETKRDRMGHLFSNLGHKR